MCRQHSTIDEKTRPRRKLAALTKDCQHKSDSTDTGTDQPGQQVRGSRLNASTEYHKLARIAKGPLKDIPAIYSKWEPLFCEVEAELALPQHQPWDHVINIEPGKTPTFGLIYQLSKTELEELCKYLDENLKKRFIRKSQSLAGSPILFISKKTDHCAYVLTIGNLMTSQSRTDIFYQTSANFRTNYLRPQ